MIIDRHHCERRCERQVAGHPDVRVHDVADELSR